MQLSPRLSLMLATPPLLWAGNAVVGRIAIGSIDPLWLNALRWVVAFALLLPLGWKALATPAARAQIAARWGYLAVLGLIGVGAYNALQYMALRTSTPLNVTLIASSSPVWTMIIGALVYRVHPRRLQLAGAALSLAGVALVLARGDLASLAQIRFVEGDLHPIPPLLRPARVPERVQPAVAEQRQVGGGVGGGEPGGLQRQAP